MKKLCVALALLVSVSALPAFASGIRWLSYENAMKTAAEENKKIFMVFHTKRCGYCKAMKATTFSHDAVISYLNANYVAVSIDADEKQEIADKFGVGPVPVSFFLRPEGTSIGKRLGYMNSKQFLKLIKMVQTQF